MNNPLVSAIVSTYNSATFIEGKIKDLLNQTIADKIEIIIINSGSQENEDEIIKEYLHHPNLKYIKTEVRESIYKAWNRGIKISRGQFITNANTDDRLKKDALEIMINVLKNNPDIGLVYPDQFITPIPNLTFEELQNGMKLKTYKFADFNYVRQLDRCLISSQPVWRADLHFNDNIWFDEKYEVCGDYDFTMKVAQKYPLLHLHQFLGVFYLSPKKENKSFKESELGKAEMSAISEPMMRKYILESDENEIRNLMKVFMADTSLPLPLFYLIKKIRLMGCPQLVYTRYFHTIEYIYFFSILQLEKVNQIKEAIRLSRKYLRYGKSNRISKNLKSLMSR